MKSSNEIVLTPQGLAELKSELAELINVKRPQIIAELKEARAQQDLSENAGYEAARTNQALIENRINQIEMLIKTSKVVEVNKKNKNVVKIGSQVTILNLKNQDISKIKILGPLESNPFKEIISSASPLGQALLNNKVGSIVTVKAPEQVYKVKIQKINFE